MKETTKRRLKVMISSIVVLFAAASAFLYLYDFPKKIDLVFPAMEYRVGKPDSGEATTIKVIGTLNSPLFRDPYFHGQFIVDKYDYTKIYQLRDFEFNQDIVFYHGNNKGTPFQKFLGYLVTSDNFAQLNIVVFEEINDNQRSDRDLRISAPAKNYEEAMKINEELYGY